MTNDSGHRKPHAVCFSYPAQGHINPMLKFAKLLHSKGFHITLVNTDFNHRRMVKSHGAAVLSGLPNFRFASIPDGLPPCDAEVTQDVPSVLHASTIHFLDPLCKLIEDLNNAGGDVPPVSVIVVDGLLFFALDAGEKFGLPVVFLWTASACSLLAYTQYRRLVNDGFVPFKDMKNGYMNQVVEPIVGVKGGLKLREFTSFMRTDDPQDFMLNYHIKVADSIFRAKAVVFNSYSALEGPVLAALSHFSPSLFTVGPLHLRMPYLPESPLKALGSNLWREDPHCINWLDHRAPGSVLYVNFGSITVVTAAELREFAWGLANSGSPFLWVVRPDMVTGDSAMLDEEFLNETKERGLLISWCPQEKVLGHPSTGGFLNHSGWNSTIESISSGVPMLCWPFFADQPTNCRFSCVEWGIAMEIDNNVRREQVEAAVRELMEGEKGKKMREKVRELKRKAEAEAAPGGLSDVNLDKFIQAIMH